jgi:ribonuclease HI
MNARPEKYISIFSDSHAGLKALQAVKTPSQLVQRHKKPLNVIFTHQSVVLFWVPGHSGLSGKDSAGKLEMEGSERGLFDQNRLWGPRTRI